MYFGLGNFPVDRNFIQNIFNPNQQPPQQPQQRQQPPPRNPNQQNHQFPQNQNNHNNGFNIFGGLNNFINQNFMNPFNQNNRQPNHRENQQQPRQSYFRRANNKQEHKAPSPEKAPQLNETSGLYWKNKGNEAYKNGQYTLAIGFYNKAIEIDNTQSIFFSNRAQCYKKLGCFDDALKDTQQSIELDSSNIKAHKLSGQILAQLGKKQDSIKKLQNSINRFRKALSLCGGKKNKQEQQICRLIYLAKKVLFYIKFNMIRNSRIAAINEYKRYLDEDDKINLQTKQLKMKQFIEASNQKIDFTIPSYLICQITFQIMEDPVVTDSGQTYQREAIELHITKNGKTDPFTRKPIKGPLYPCITIKKAVEQFLQRNPWAFQHSQGQNYKEITF